MPRWLRRLLARIRNRRFDAELREELEAHRDMLQDDLLAAGVDQDEARTRASRQLGNVTLARESAREVWVAPWLEGLTYDLRYGVRLFLRRPAFTASAILTLGLGLGAGTSVFSLIDAAVLHPLDVPDPSRLLTIQRTDRPRGVEVGRATINWANAERLRARAPFEDVAFSTTGADPASQRLLLSAAGPDAADMIDGRFVSANYFRVLGLGPALGRGFEERDDSPTPVPSVILGYRYWQRRFSADSDVIGRWLRINGSAALVIGVGPRGFRGTELGVTQPDIYFPLMSAPRLARDTGVQNDGAGSFWVGMTGRMPSAVSPVASLLLARAEARRDEFAVRVAQSGTAPAGPTTGGGSRAAGGRRRCVRRATTRRWEQGTSMRPLG